MWRMDEWTRLPFDYIKNGIKLKIIEWTYIIVESKDRNSLKTSLIIKIYQFIIIKEDYCPFKSFIITNKIELILYD